MASGSASVTKRDGNMLAYRVFAVLMASVDMTLLISVTVFSLGLW